MRKLSEREVLTGPGRREIVVVVDDEPLPRKTKGGNWYVHPLYALLSKLPPGRTLRWPIQPDEPVTRLHNILQVAGKKRGLRFTARTQKTHVKTWFCVRIRD